MKNKVIKLLSLRPLSYKIVFVLADPHKLLRLNPEVELPGQSLHVSQEENLAIGIKFFGYP